MTEAVGDPIPGRAVPSLAQEVLIASIDPSKGQTPTLISYAIAAALLVELAQEGRVEVSGTGKKAEVSIRDSAPLGDPDLDSALAALSAQGRSVRVSDAVVCVPGQRDLIGRLKAEGLLVEESYKKWGMFTKERLEPTPASGRDALVARVRSVLLGESPPDDRLTLLIPLIRMGSPLMMFSSFTQLEKSDRRALKLLKEMRQDHQVLIDAVEIDRDRGTGGDSSAT